MITLKIEGATCGGCAKSIEKAINQVTGVSSVAFSLDTQLAQIEGTADHEQLVDAIESAGFDVIGDA